MWELVKRSLQRERTMTAAQLGRPRRASVQRMHNEIVEAFLKAGRQRVRRSATGRLGSVDSVVGEGVGRGSPRGVRGGLWRAVSSLGFAIAMAIRLLNPYVLISVALGQRQSLLAHLSARVDSMRAVLSPRIGRRRRLTAWVQDTLPQRHIPEAVIAVWQDGSLLCGIVDAAVPGSCPGYDSLTPPNTDRGATLWLGQKLAARYLGVPPAFSDDEFSIPHLTIHMERRMLRYLSALKSASAKVEAERQRRQAALESSGASVLQEDAFSLDTIANSSLPPGESLLECVARGMGLILGVQGRKSTFYLYLNPNHPHRHVQRLMRTSTLERQPSFDDEAGAILMQIRGPEGDFGATLLSTAPGSSSSTLGTSLEIMNENWYGRIPISYETTEESVMVYYVPQTSGPHELILLQRGGSHVPGSPFSITVEDSSEVPDDNGTVRRFGSEPVDGLLPAPKTITKAASYESGLDKGHRRLGSGGSDPGTRSEGDSPPPGVTFGMGKRRRVVARVVDFVTEKMLLTEDGKLERLPKRRKVGREERSSEKKNLLSEDAEVREITGARRYSTLYTSLSRMKHLEVDEPIHGTYPGRRSPVDYGKSETTYGISKSGLEMDTVSSEYSSRVYKGKRRGSEKMVRLSEIASHSGKESLDSINFREHCRRILWLCDILLKHSPRQESLEILNTAGDILDGKRVHPTIMEESEPEDASIVTPPQSITVPLPVQSQDSAQPSDNQAQEPRAIVSPTPSKSLAQRLKREPSDTGGLNEVSAWKDGRRQYHSWTRKDREGSGVTVGGRLIHKGGSYRGVVVRDMTPEALSGAYTGGDELMEDEGSQKGGLDDDDLTEEDVSFYDAGIAASGMARHSLPKIRPPSLGKQMKCRRASVETQEQRSSDRETGGGRTTVSGKELNKSIAPNDKGQINYSDRGSGQAGGGGKEKDRVTGVKAGALRSGEGLEDHPRCHSEKEDKSPCKVTGKNIVLAVAVALAEGEMKGSEGESWEEPLSNIGTSAIPGEEEENEKCDKELLDASSKGEPPPVEDHKGLNDEGHEGTVGEEVAACGGEDEEEERRQESLEPPTAETCEARKEINELPPTPTREQPTCPPSPPIHGAGAEQSPESQEGVVSESSDVAKGGESTESGYPQTVSGDGKEEEESAVIKKEEEEERKQEKNKGDGQENDMRVDNDIKVKAEAAEHEGENENDAEIMMVTTEKEKINEEPKQEMNEIVKTTAEICGEKTKENNEPDHENLGLRAESEISKNLGERVEKQIVVKATEILENGEEENLTRLEEKVEEAEEKTNEANVEYLEQGKKGGREKSVAENHRGIKNTENHSEILMKDGKENEGNEENLRVEEKKGLTGIEEQKSEEVGKNVEESRFTNDVEGSSPYETEKVGQSISEGENQLVVMTGETHSVKETVVGNEDQRSKSDEIKNEESFRMELQPELEIDVVEMDKTENEKIAVEKVVTEKDVEGENFNKISADTKFREHEGRREEEQEWRLEVKEYNEHNVIPDKSNETEGKVLEKDEKNNIEKGGDGRKKIEEMIAIAESEMGEMSSEKRSKKADACVVGDEISPKREKPSHKRGITKEDDREDVSSKLFRVNPDKNLIIGEFHEVLKLEDAFFTSAMGIQNTKECGNSQVIPDEKENTASCEEKEAKSVPEGKIVENNTMRGLQVTQGEEFEREKELEETGSNIEKSTEEKEEKGNIDSMEIKTKSEPDLDREEVKTSKVAASNLKENMEIKDASTNLIQMQKNEETSVLSFSAKKKENFGDSNLLNEFCAVGCSIIKESSEYFNPFIEESLVKESDDRARKRENDAEVEKKGESLQEIDETQAVPLREDGKVRNKMREIVSQEKEAEGVGETRDMKEKTLRKVEVENSKSVSPECTQELMGNAEEMGKMESEKEISTTDNCTAKEENEVIEESESEGGIVFRTDNVQAAKENKVEEKCKEEGNRFFYMEGMERGKERENKDHTGKEENKIINFEDIHIVNITTGIHTFKKDNMACVDNTQIEKRNNDITNEQIMGREINPVEMTENTLHEKHSDGKGMETDVVKYDETSTEKSGNAKISTPQAGEEYENKTEHIRTGKKSPQEDEDKIDFMKDAAEKTLVYEEIEDTENKKKSMQSNGEKDENEKADEKPQVKESTEKISKEIPSYVNETKSQMLPPKIYEGQKTKKEEISEQFSAIIESETESRKEVTHSPMEKAEDGVREMEIDAQVYEPKKAVPMGADELEKIFKATSLDINSIMEGVKTVMLEKTAVDSLMDLEIETYDNTFDKAEKTIGKCEEFYFREKNEPHECNYIEPTQTAECKGSNSPAKGSCETFLDNAGGDGAKKCKPISEEPISPAAIVEDGEVKRKGEGEHQRKGIGNEEKAPMEGEKIHEEEKPSKEDPTRPCEEEDKVVPVEAEAKSPTYSEIIGRILCTDSFPSESLEWFEEEGKKGEEAEAVEGTMESMEEAGGGEAAAAVEAGTAVGDEVWELPEIAREEDPPLEIEGSREGGPETRGEGGGAEQECEDSREGEEEEGDEDGDQWSSGTPSNLEEEEEAGCSQEGGGGPSLRVGVGVVVAGGIVSRDSSRRDNNEGRDAAWRRSKWRASRSKSIEEGIPLPKEDPVGREWEEICMGIDAMEDGSISQVIAEVSGKRRRRRTRKERGDRSGKAMRTGYGRWARDGTEAAGKEPPIAELQTPADERVAEKEAQQVSRPLKRKGGGMTSAGVILEEEDEEEKGEKEVSEGTGASREESPRVGMLGDPRWYSSSSWSSSLGGVKVEELRVDWVGAMEEGKRGRGPAEEEGVEAREGLVEEAGSGEKEGEGAEERVNILPGDKGVSFAEITPPEVSRIKGSSTKDLDGPVVALNKGINLDEIAEGKGKGEKLNTEAIEHRKSDQRSGTTTPKCEESRETEVKREVRAKEEKKAENLEGGDEEDIREEEREGEEVEEEEEDDDVGEKTTKDPSHAVDEDFNETAGEKSDETELENVLTGEESEKGRWDGEKRESKSMQSPEDDIFPELENKHSPKEGESFFGRRDSNRGKILEAQSSGEWEFIDTGRHFAGNENSEGETPDEWEGQFPRGNYASDSKGLSFYPFVGNRDSSQSLSVVSMGIELLHSLVDIPKGEVGVSNEGASPKREGEELFGVRMTLDEWDRKKEPNYIGSEAEVVVGEFDLLSDWDHGVGKIGFIEVTTNEHQQDHRIENEERMEIHGIGVENETFTKKSKEKDEKTTEIGYVESKPKSPIISTENYVISEDLESNRKEKEEESEPQDDDDVEEIVRTEPDDWGRGTFTFTDSDHRSAFRNFEDLLGGDVSFRMTTCTAQFNLWPSDEAFEGKGTWMEHIDMDAFMSTAQSRQKSCSGKGLLEGMTTFAKTCTVGDEKGSTTTREQHYFTRDGEGREMKKEVHEDGDEEEIVLVEQDFDDYSDEIEGNLDSTSHWESTYQSFDMGRQPNISKGDAFAIFESPGVTTRIAQEDEQVSDDESASDESRSGKNQSRATLCDNEEMEMLELDGDWEEGIVFVDDDDDKDIPISGRRGSGEYRKFGGEVEGRMDADLWGAMLQSNVDSSSGDTAFAIVMDTEEIKEKTPVLPTGRWCPRLPLLSPAMSAISEEESEEICPERDEKQDEESGSFQTDNEWDNQSSRENQSSNEIEDEKAPENTIVLVPASEDEGHKTNLGNVTDENIGQLLAVTLMPDEADSNNLQVDDLEKSDTKHQLPKLDVEVEDGFGESFSRRRSSTSSVLSDTTTAEPMADCGAAFVVSSELAVTLALGVSITQIIPPTMDLPEIPPLPQVELAADALRVDHANEEEKREFNKDNDPLPMNNAYSAQSQIANGEQKTNAKERTVTEYYGDFLLNDITSNRDLKANVGITERINGDFNNSTGERKNIPAVTTESKEQSDVAKGKNHLEDFNRVNEKKIDKDERVSQMEAEEDGIKNSIERNDGIDFLFPERNVNWYDEDEEVVNCWSNETLMSEKFPEKEEIKLEKTESVSQLQTTESGKENTIAIKYDVDFLFPESNVNWYDDDEELVDCWSNEKLTSEKFAKTDEIEHEKTEYVSQLQTTESGKENNIAIKYDVDFLFPESNVNWYDEDEEVVDCWSSERIISQNFAKKEEIELEKVESLSRLQATESGKENNIAIKYDVDFLFPESNVNWYDDDEEVDCWSNGRLMTRTFAEKEEMKDKKLEEEKLIALACEERGPEKEQSAVSGGEVAAEIGENKRPAEGKGKSSPPGGARKKESPDKKTRDSPRKPIPLEKLLGWPSENGNGNNGLGCPGIASRRESVFDDYNFSLWENGFKLNRETDTGRGSKRQDSTGLEYYLDVDQLLNVPLAATEPEVKYVSAKEIMETFTRGMDSPEKTSDRDSESKGEKASKSDSLDDSLLGAIGGASIGFLDERLLEETAGSSQMGIETESKEPDLLSDDLFAEFCRSNSSAEHKTGQEEAFTLSDENGQTKVPTGFTENGREFEEKKSYGKIADKYKTDNESEEKSKDLPVSPLVGDRKKVKSTELGNLGDLRQHGIISNKGSDGETKSRREILSGGGKVRNMIGIFERPASTKSPVRKDMAPPKEGKKDKRTLSTFEEIKSTDDFQFVLGNLGEREDREIRLQFQEPTVMFTEAEVAVIPHENGRSPVTTEDSAGRKEKEAETINRAQFEGASSDIGRTAESKSTEHHEVEEENLIEIEEAQLKEIRLPTLEEKRGEILSLTEEPVVGWEAIKVATEVENIILSTGNGIEQKRNVMGEVIILAEPDKQSGAVRERAKEGMNIRESDGRQRENRRTSYSSRKGNGSEDKAEETKVVAGVDRSMRTEESLRSRKELMSTSSSFEEYKSVVCEAYQFLEALGDTVDEDEEEALPGEEAKETTGGKAEDSVGGLGSEVEVYHPCEELPDGERETIPRGVEGAPIKGQAEAQSSPSSPERCKTTESSTSSSPYSSLPTFADISSGILSSASSKDENSLRTEDGPSRKERASHKTHRGGGAPKTETERTTGDAPATAGDILEEEMDSTTLAKMNVASRKEYWDRRLQRAQEKSKEPVTVGSKPSPLRFSGIVARGRMSFEKSSKDESSTSDSGGDGGKSSSESSPTSRGKQFSQRPKAFYSKGVKSSLPPKPVKKEPEEEVSPREEKETLRPMDEHSMMKIGDERLPKEITIPSGEEIVQQSRDMDDKEDLSQISVSKRKEIWNQKVPKMSEDESPPSSLEYRRSERKMSSRVESVENIVTQSSIEDRSERRASSIRVKSVVPRYRKELEEQSLSIDSSSVDDKAGKEIGVKKVLPIKTTGSVSQLAKLFSSPPPEPSPTRYRGGRPVSKGKYSKGPETSSLSSKDESVEDPRGSAESSSSATSMGKIHAKTFKADTAKIGSRSPSPGESLVENAPSDDKNGKKLEGDRKNTGFSPSSKSSRGVGDRSTFRTDSETSETDNLASRRQKYLESVQQSLEGEESRHEGTFKKSESEDSLKERMRKKGISDVRNIWEKRASLDGSSSSESMKRPLKFGTISPLSNSNKKRVAQEKRPTTKASVGHSAKANDAQNQVESPDTGTEVKGGVETAQEKSAAQDKAVSSTASSLAAKGKGLGQGDTLSHAVAPVKEASLDTEKANETQPPSSDENRGGISAASFAKVSGGLHEKRPSLKDEGRPAIFQEQSVTAQLAEAKIEKVDTRDSASEREANQAKVAEGSVQPGGRVSRVERPSEAKFAARERTAQGQTKSHYSRGLPQEKEVTSRAEAKVTSAESTASSPFKGRRHSCATVVSPPKKVNLSKTREKCGSVEEKMLEFQTQKVKRDSLEIRVTDDEDVCVMREVTSVPRFASKETKMDTHEEEEVDEKGRKVVAGEEGEEDAPKTTLSPSANRGAAAARRRSLPQRTLSIQVSGIVASGRRRFESGKAVAEDMPTLAEEIAETANKSRIPVAIARRSPEERRETTSVQGIEEEEEEEDERDYEDRGPRSVPRGGRQDGGDMEESPKVSDSGGRELYWAVPANVTAEAEQRVVAGREGVRSMEARPSSEETSPARASKVEEGGEDGRSATSRRATKGKAPPPAKQQSPPSAASSPDSESEGAADSKLRGFLSTPAAQIRRHSAVDVATLRSFTASDEGAAASSGGPRLRRRGSGDLGSPSRPKKEDESRKRFTRARQFFETLERGKDSPPSPPQSPPEDAAPATAPLTTAAAGKKKKSSREKEERPPLGTSSLGRRTGGAKYRPPVPRAAKDSSGSTTDSDKERKHRSRKVRRTPSTHSAPGSDVDSSGGTPHNHPSLHRRRRDKEFVLRSQRFGGSEREVRVSERFNVMDLFRDVAGPGTGVSSGRATPLGIPHQAAVLAALRSVEDVRSCETTSPYDMYRPVEADNDCEPSSAGAANASGAEDEAEGVPQASSSAADGENANLEEDEEGNVTFSSPMTMCVKKEYHAEYPHLPITSPRNSRHRSSNTDLIPRNVLLQRDANDNSPGKSTSSRRSIAELF